MIIRKSGAVLLVQYPTWCINGLGIYIKNQILYPTSVDQYKEQDFTVKQTKRP